MLIDPFKLPPQNTFFWIKIKRLWAKTKVQESAGTIVYFKNKKLIPLFLLIQRGDPYNDWVFPKGVIEEEENPKQTALLETFEETGLKVKIIKQLTSNFYQFYWDLTNNKFNKTVHYFLAESSSQKTSFDHMPRGDEESKTFKQIKWFNLEEAVNIVKHIQEKELLKEASKDLLKILIKY